MRKAVAWTSVRGQQHLIRPVRELRDLVRMGTQLIREARRIQKALDDANIKLTSLISEIVVDRASTSFPT
jgi:hypothetical protein